MSGRPKLVISKKFLYDLEIELGVINWEDRTLKIEDELLKTLKINHYKSMSDFQFNEFIKTHFKIIQKCRYILNNRYKNYFTLIEINKIEIHNRTDEENHILELADDIFSLSCDEYYNYFNILKHYRSTHHQKVKEKQKVNQVNKTSESDQTKRTQRKKLNHEKFFIGGALLSLLYFLNPKLDKDPTEIFIEMCKIYLMHTTFLHDHEQLIAAFHQNQHLSILDEVSSKLYEIQNDPRNPFQKGESGEI